MSKTKTPIGRPSDFSQELADEICYRIANGEGLVKICKDEHIPARSTVMRWIFKIPEFQDKYTLAREQQADFYFEEILEIADGSEKDSYIDEKGNQRVDHENINRSRLRVDTRKWVIARLAPKKYGDRVEFDAEDKNWTVNGIPVKTK
jgi:hypothetical protein